MPERREFLAEILSCAVCGPEWRQGFPAVLDTHEVIRGGRRVAMIQDRRAWLCVCRVHHDEIDDLSQWPIVLQFALKSIQDPEWFDLKWLNAQRGEGDGFSMAEVSAVRGQFLTWSVRRDLVKPWTQ